MLARIYIPGFANIKPRALQGASAETVYSSPEQLSRYHRVRVKATGQAAGRRSGARETCCYINHAFTMRMCPDSRYFTEKFNRGSDAPRNTRNNISFSPAFKFKSRIHFRWSCIYSPLEQTHEISASFSALWSHFHSWEIFFKRQIFIPLATNLKISGERRTSIKISINTSPQTQAV